jgi:hypothetical protein
VIEQVPSVLGLGRRARASVRCSTDTFAFCGSITRCDDENKRISTRLQQQQCAEVVVHSLEGREIK